MNGHKTNLAYCAGVIDSDGTIGVHVNWYKVRGKHADSKQPTYQPRVCVKQVEPHAVRLLRELFGGSLCTDGGGDNRRPLFRWEVTSKAVGPVLEALAPYLRIKSAQAVLALELCALNAGRRRLTFDLPKIVPGEPMLPLTEAADRAGKSYAVAQQSVKLGNVPFERRGRRVFVPESYIDVWRERGRSPMRHPTVSARMAAIKDEITALNRVGPR